MKGDFLVNAFIVLALTLGMCSRNVRTNGIEQHGFVKKVQLEGGFYGIITSAGEQLEPVNLPPEFAVDGLKVYVKYKSVENGGSVYQWGMPVEIITIRIE